jgi:pyruvate dehydrogenase E2 component (dihydrolipoamide acetyltransferase)
MATPIEMPKLGNTVEECLLSRWYKQSGDAIAEGDILAEIETDKATFELTSPVSGTLLEIFFNDGDLVPVYANVCVVGKEGESTEEFKPRTDTVTPEMLKPDTVSPVKQSEYESVSSRTAALPVAGDPTQASFSPRARRFAEEHHFHPLGFRGTGPGGRILEEDLKRLYYELPRSSSLAEKMTADGYEIRGAGGSGHPTVLSSDLTAPPTKMSAVRDRIARRMWDSLATTAQYTMNASADATGLLSLRNRIKTREQQGGFPSINVNEIVVFCAIKALTAVPEINAEFVDGKIYRHSNIHIGFACDTPKGLLVPVIRNSQTLTLPELSSRIKSLTKQAVDGIISPDDLSGGTFTISNLGSFGIESFSPILNPPQVAILGVNAIDLKPVRRNEKIEFIEHIGLSLTCDHQVIDGAQGARFLKTIIEQIENIEGISGLDI